MYTQQTRHQAKQPASGCFQSAVAAAVMVGPPAVRRSCCCDGSGLRLSAGAPELPLLTPRQLQQRGGLRLILGSGAIQVNTVDVI